MAASGWLAVAVAILNGLLLLAHLNALRVISESGRVALLLKAHGERQKDSCATRFARARRSNRQGWPRRCRSRGKRHHRFLPDGFRHRLGLGRRQGLDLGGRSFALGSGCDWLGWGHSRGLNNGGCQRGSWNRLKCGRGRGCRCRHRGWFWQRCRNRRRCRCRCRSDARWRRCGIRADRVRLTCIPVTSASQGQQSGGEGTPQRIARWRLTRSLARHLRKQGRGCLGLGGCRQLLDGGVKICHLGRCRCRGLNPRWLDRRLGIDIG